MTASCHVAAMPTADLDRIGSRGVDVGNAVVVTVNQNEGGEAAVGEHVALVAHQPARVGGPYAEVGPVFHPRQFVAAGTTARGGRGPSSPPGPPHEPAPTAAPPAHPTVPAQVGDASAGRVAPPLRACREAPPASAGVAAAVQEVPMQAILVWLQLDLTEVTVDTHV